MAPTQPERGPVGQIAASTSTYLSCPLLDLSTELLVEILAYLPAVGMFSTRRTCRTIHKIVDDTPYLQYIIHVYINGVNDFLSPDFPYGPYSHRRLELLRRHEQSWSDLQFNLLTEHAISIPYPARFSLQDGYLIYTDARERSRYGYINLCSASEDQEVPWVHITIDDSHFPCMSMVTFAIDHDLVVATRFVSCLMLS
jgi:hypothetical protein